MKYFVNIYKKIKSILWINASDSDTLKAKKVIWYSFFGSILIILVVSWLIFVVTTFNRENIKVPNLIGDNIYDALKKLYDKKLFVNVNPRFNDEFDAGIVYRQRPHQGSSVKKGRLIQFYVSMGPRVKSLPDFSGFSLFDLEDYLEKNYPDGNIPFKIDLPVYEYNQSIDKGNIFKQVPEEGEPIYNVKKVKFWISNGIKDEGALTIENFIGQNIEDVSRKLSSMELYYTYEFQMVDNIKEDMIVVDQSIGEGKSIEEIIEEGKVIELTVNKYRYIDGDQIKGTYLLDLPKKPLPFLVEVKVDNGGKKEKTLLTRKTKGGVSLPVLYTGKKDMKLKIYYDGKFINEIQIYNPEEQKG